MCSHPSHKTQTVYEKLFERFSVDDRISETNFYVMCNFLSEKFPYLKHANKYYFRYFDLDNSKNFTYQQIMIWWESPMRRFLLRDPTLLTKAGDLYTSHTEGEKMTIAEFQNLGSTLSKDFDQDIFDFVDVNSDGYISFQEFIRWLGWFKEE